MIKSKKSLLIALLFPILALVVLTGYKKYILSVGEEVVLPISGYDPRDLLSGHYLIYTIDYGVKNICSGNSYRQNKKGYVCLDPKKFSSNRPTYCRLYIEGICKNHRFEAGIERYYIPQKEARRLEKLVQERKASLRLSVTRDGKVQIKDLLIDDIPWEEVE